MPGQVRDAARIGATITALREAKGMGRATVARMVGKSPAWLARVEAGSGSLDSAAVAELAHALAVPPLAIAYCDGGLRARSAASSTSSGTPARSSGVTAA